MDAVTDLPIDTVVEVLSQLIGATIELVVASENVIIEKKCFAQLSVYLHKIVPLLSELGRNDLCDSYSLRKFVEILNHQIKLAKQLIQDCSHRNRFYLFVSSRSIAKRIGDINQEISSAMSCLPLASLDISLSTRDDIGQLVNKMKNTKFKAAVAEEEILEKIEFGIFQRNVDRTFANNLLVSIAKAVGVSTDRTALRKEFEEFKTEIDNLRLRKNEAEAIRMDQIIALLERADIASSFEDRKKKYLIKRNSLGMQPLEPLMTFSCPITKEVMVDPVETPLGYTFERSSIEKWLADNQTCPLTSTPLDSSILRPNKTLRQSIEEWQERNTMIILASLKSRISSAGQEEVLVCLNQLLDLCEQREIHQEWLILEDYIPTLFELLHVKDRSIRNKTLQILCLLAKYNDDAKEIIAKVENSIKYIVQSLGRQLGEGKLAVAILLELSKCESVRDYIGNVQGCILLLVTMLTSDDHQAANDAKNVLDNLAFSDDNVVLMANNNYFKYLLQRLSAGPDHVQMAMAKTLGEMELTNHNKSSLVEDGVLDLLLVLISHDYVEMKIVAVGALLNLSTLTKNGQEAIKKQAVRPLLDILTHQTSSQRLRELVSAVLVNLALSTIPENSAAIPVQLLESEEDILGLYSLINFMGPGVQQNILRVFHAMCLSPSAVIIKSKLRQRSSMPMLLRFCEVDDSTLRANAVKLLCCLTEDYDGAEISEHMTRSSVEALLMIIRNSENDEEVSSALGTIANLPESAQISEWLLESHNLTSSLTSLFNSDNIRSKKSQFTETVVGAICRLTVETNMELQKKVVEIGVIENLLLLLEMGSSLTRRKVGVSLTQLSLSSPALSRQTSRRPVFRCFSALPKSCPVHHGICTVVSSFCLLEAGAVKPLVQVLRWEPNPEACEAALDALLTLIDGESLHNGCKVLEEANAIAEMIKLISHPSPCTRLQEKIFSSLERIFRIFEYKQKYGQLTQRYLVDLTQRGNSNLRSLAARILARLNVLHDQSSFF
ncbi:U-box domain-containing protein 44-like [Dorcoceras hygrometricum]|uniref:RING-type E3 ubiquitin transferase n=1 Tax=Dorcoceras hygrometricum TaxID=472368 RepID=A0A2Z7C8Z4_9LAMI|nr:U-box domain-containing protein 44-like [Dorcoceras hygrometricum]